MKIKSYTKKIVGDVPKEYPEQIFNELLAFQGYGFNECLDIHSLVELIDGTKKELKDVEIGDYIKSKDDKTDQYIFVEVLNKYHNNKELYEVITESGKKIKASMDHKFKTPKGMQTLYNITCDNNDIPMEVFVEDKHGFEKITSCLFSEINNTIDLEVNHEDHQFFANGILVSNSHSVAYSLYSAVDLFFKAHYPMEFICCYMNQCNRTDEIEGINAIKYLITYARKKGISVFKPDINESQNKWIIYNNGLTEGLLFPLRDMMLLNNIDINSIIDNRPYKSFEDFYERIGNKMNEKKLEHLICSEVFHKFGDVDIILSIYNSLKNKTNTNQLDFFDDIDNMVSDTPILTKKEQKQYQEEMLNYTFEKLLEDEFRKYIDEYNKKAKENNFTRLKTLYEIEDSNVKFTLVIAKIEKLTMFTPKNGRGNKYWIFLTDGLYNAKMMASQDDVESIYKRYFREGNVVQIPILVSDQSRNVFFFNKNASKAEIKLLKENI